MQKIIKNQQQYDYYQQDLLQGVCYWGKMDTLAELKALIKSRLAEKVFTQRSLSDACDIEQGSLSRFLADKTTLSGEGVIKLMRYLGVDVVFPGSTPVMRRIAVHAPECPVDGEDILNVPVVRVVGCGAGRYELEVSETIKILKQFAHENLSVCKIHGTSMEPVIKDGAYVGVVPLDGPPADGGLYVVYDDVLGAVAKYVFFAGQGQLVLRSANPNSPDIALDARGYDGVIVGKVVWVWQQI